MGEPRLIVAAEPPASPARTRPPRRPPFRIGAVQERWHPDPDEHRAALARGVELAAAQGARLVCLQELTLSRYFAVDPGGPAAAGAVPERLPGGPTHELAAALAAAHGIHVHASLFERAEGDASDEGEAGDGGAEGDGGEAGGAGDQRGYNTAIVVAPDGRLVARTRKLHIPVTAGYHEDRYFRPGPAAGDPYPLLSLADAAVGLPTCWDQWFPEVARAYGLAGADLVVYPTAIGSEPDHPEFDTQPLWRQVIVANGIANGLFMCAVNRTGTEPPLTFYGSSFISDPYGRILAEAPREEPAVLVADLDLDQRRDWLDLFPFLATRRPDTYRTLVDLTESERNPDQV